MSEMQKAVMSADVEIPQPLATDLTTALFGKPEPEKAPTELATTQETEITS